MTDQYYDLCPKDAAENLVYRRKILIAARKDEKVARALWTACAESPLFFFNTFLWTHDPRKQNSRLPFVTYDFQDPIILSLVASIMGGEQRAVLKNRDMGLTWCALGVMKWFWTFGSHKNFLVLSRKEDLVDKPGSPASLFWKLDFMYQHLPGFLKGKLNRTSMRFENVGRVNVIEGESTNPNCGRAGRYTAIMWDETSSSGNESHAIMDSISESSPCKWYISTPQGCGNAFYDVCHNPSIELITVDWWKHPEKALGLTKDAAGEYTSPWFERKRAELSPMTLAQEVLHNFAGSDSQFFEQSVLQRCAETVREGVRGELMYDDAGNPQEFTPCANGRLRLWCRLSEEGKPAADTKYAVGADIAMGTGASNSAASGLAISSGEKVFELVSPNMRPDEFATYTVALARWFGDAFLTWEATGPGRSFGDQVLKLRYWNIYYHRDERKVNSKLTDAPGWFSTTDRRQSLLTEFRQALHTGAFIQRSADSLAEARVYVYTKAGVNNGRAANVRDPAGAKANHGDRVIADALAWHGSRDIAEKGEPIVAKPKVAWGSLTWRRQQRKRVNAGSGRW